MEKATSRAARLWLFIFYPWYRPLYTSHNISIQLMKETRHNEQRLLSRVYLVTIAQAQNRLNLGIHPPKNFIFMPIGYYRRP